MKRAFIYLVLIFVINLPGIYYSLYMRWWWFDVSLHFLGGFFVAMFLVHYLKDRLITGNNEWIKNALVVVGATVFIGVVWEFAEYIANQLLIGWVYKTFTVKTYFMGDLKDTILDLLLDIIGALTFCLYSFKNLPKNV